MPRRLTPTQHQALGALATSSAYGTEPPGTTYPDRAGIERLGSGGFGDRLPVYPRTYDALLRCGYIEEFDHEPTGQRLARVSVAGGEALRTADERIREAARRERTQTVAAPVLTGHELYYMQRAQAAQRRSLTATQWRELPHATQVRLEALGFFQQDGPDPTARRMLTSDGEHAIEQHHRRLAEQWGSAQGGGHQTQQP